MDLPRIVSRTQWVAARKELLAREKEATRTRDALSAKRRALPMVEIERSTSSTARAAARACAIFSASTGS